MKLQIVVLIEKYKKVTDVAAELGLKQPTISFHMKSLESELGTPLFQYRSGRVFLTDAGRVLYPYAVKIVSLTAEAERSIKQLSSPSHSYLELVSGSIPGSYLLPKLMPAFMRNHPGVNLSLSMERDHLLRERLRAQEIPFALLHGAETGDASFNYQHIASDEPVLIYAPGHPFDTASPLTADEVAQVPWIQHSAGSFLRGISDQWARLNHIRPWTRAEMDSPETLKGLISQGGAVGVFSRVGIEDELALDRLRCSPLPGILPESGGFMLAWCKDHTLTPLQQALVDSISQI